LVASNRPVRLATKSLLAAAGLMCAAQAGIAAEALPHLIRLDLAVDAAGNMAHPQYASASGTLRPSPQLTVALRAAAALVLVGAAVVVPVRSATRFMQRAAVFVVLVFIAIPSVRIVDFLLFEKGVDDEEQRLTVNLATSLHADRFKDVSYMGTASGRRSDRGDWARDDRQLRHGLPASVPRSPRTGRAAQNT
jgi:hypothetical protein